MREGDYSRMVRLFSGELLSSHGFFPLSAMALGFSWRRKTRGIEMMEVCADGFAEAPERLFY
jgi:hypothetical protein